MKRKQIFKKIALWAAGVSAFCALGFVVPTIIRSVGEATQSSEKNTAAPQITIDSEGYDLNQAPQAVAGKEYRIFNATAKDSYGNDLKVAKKVWLYYYSTTKSRVSVTDGIFTPQQAGEYVVEYTAIDRDGNKGSAVYEVDCVGNNGLSFSLGEKVETGVAGIEMQLASAAVENASGNCSVNIQAKLKDGDDVQSVGEDLRFCPMYAGTYVIEYFVSDYVSEASASYEITVEKNETPVFFGNVNVPAYFVQDRAYQLDVPKAYHFALGVPVEIEPVLTVQDKQGNTVTLENGEFTPAAAGDVTIKYTASYGERIEELVYNATVVNVDYGLLNSYHKYFYSNDYTASLTKSCVELFTMTDNAQVDFINPVLARDAKVVFTANTKYKNFGALEVYFTDSLDSSIQVKFTLRNKQGGGTNYTLNDADTYGAQISLFNGEKLELGYNNGEHTFNLNASLNVLIKETLSGEPFNGFPSERINVSFRLVGVEGPAGLLMYKINNQNFNFNASDAEPGIVFFKHEGGEMNVGDVVPLNRFYVGDVLDYDSVVKYYVKAPNGEFVTALDGTLLDGNGVDYLKQYSIFMEMEGTYSVCMEVSDSMGNQELYAYGIKVVDRTPPTIVLTQGKTTCKVGESVEIWSADATDASGGKVEVYVYVTKPDGKVEAITNGRFYAEKAGTYTIYYQAFDAKGNATMQSYEIVVS
ncbi:MAG: hypothetical protein IJX98_00450 [Clostridia bacterium]|nr:hypothetical protein [Clostridia bacterium]